MCIRTLILTDHQLIIDGKVQYAEVRYYFKIRLQETQLERGMAMVSMYTAPVENLLRSSHHTLWSCYPGGDTNLRVIDIKSIQAVVAVVPHPKVDDLTLREKLNGRVYIGEKMGLHIMQLSGNIEDATTENE